MLDSSRHGTAVKRPAEVRMQNAEGKSQKELLHSAFCILHSAFVLPASFFCLSFVFLSFLACAHKAYPPNPDRFPPSLEDLTVVNKNRIDLTFDKPMKSSALADSDFSIVSLTGDTLP